MATNKNISYNVKTNYGSSNRETKELQKNIESLTKQVKELQRVADKEIQLKTSNASYRAMQQNIDSAIRQLDRLKNAYASIGNMHKDATQDKLINVANIQEATRALKEQQTVYQSLLRQQREFSQQFGRQARQVVSGGNIGGGTARIRTLAQEQSRLKAELQLALYNSNNDTTSQTYRNAVSRIAPELNRIRENFKLVEEETRKNISLSERWSTAIDELADRAGWVASRFLAFKLGEMLMDSFTSMVEVEQQMAGFAQVMHHTQEGAEAMNEDIEHMIPNVNNFGESIADVDVQKLVDSFGEMKEPTEEFKRDLQEMQEKIGAVGVKYGATMHDMTESAKLWGRAYKDNNTVLALTEQATKLAIADAFDIVHANEALESSIMQWGFEIKNSTDAMNVSGKIIDSWTALAHNYTVSAQTMSEANKRFAQSAREVGVSFDTAQALVAVMARKTQADGGEIGNALKSIFGSIHSTKAIKAMEDFGIAMYQTSETGEKEFRKVDDVLMDLMIKSEGSKENMEDLLKAISGGKWQWNKASAMLDYQEYVKALSLSVNSFHFTDEQVGMQLDTVAKKLQSIKTQFDAMVSSSMTSRGAIKGFLDLVLQVMEIIHRMPEGLYAVLAGLATFRVTMALTGSSAGTILGRIAGLFVGIKNAIGGACTTLMAFNRLMGQTAGATAKAGLAVRGSMGAIRGLVGLLGGWINVLLLAGSAIALYVDHVKEQGNAEQQAYDQASKRVQILEEQAQRMQAQGSVIKQLSNAMVELEDKRKEYADGSAEQKRIDEDLKMTQQELIKLYGEGAEEYLADGQLTREEAQRMMDAWNKKTAQVTADIEEERKKLQEASANMIQSNNAMIENLQRQNESWWENIKTLIEYGHVLDAVSYTMDKFRKKMSENSYNMHVNSMNNYREMAEQATDEATKQSLLAKASREEELAGGDFYNMNHWDNQIQNDFSNTIADIQQKSMDALKSFGAIKNPNAFDITKLDTSPYTHAGVGDDDEDGSKKKTKKTKEEKEAERLQKEYEKWDGSRGGVLEYANSRIGTPYLLGADGTWATDCGKLFSDAVASEFGVSSARDVPTIIAQAKEAGAWHEAGDGYVPKAGDGVVVNPTGRRDDWDGHIVVSDGTATGYTGANSSTGVIHKDSFVNDFYGTSGYVDVVKLAQYLGSNGGHGNGKANAKDPSEVFKEQLKREEEIIRKHIDAVMSVYAQGEKSIKLDEEIFGETSRTADEYVKNTKAKIDTLKGVYKEFQDKAKDIASGLTQAEQDMVKSMTGNTIEEFLGMSVAKQEEAITKVDATRDKLLATKLEGMKDLNAQYEKERQNLQNITAELIKQQRTASDRKYTELRNAVDWEQEDGDFVRKAQGKFENYEIGSHRDEDYAMRKLGIEKQYYQVMLQEQRTAEELHNQRKKIQELVLQAKNDELKMQQDIRQQAYETTNDILNNGTSLKDAWKKIWNDFANEALKMLFRIEDGNHSLLGNLIRQSDPKHRKERKEINEKIGDVGQYTDKTTARGIAQGTIDKDSVKLSASMNNLSARIDALTNAIMTNTSATTTNTSSTDTNSTSTDSNSSSVDTNSNSVDSNTDAVSSIGTDVDMPTGDFADPTQTSKNAKSKAIANGAIGILGSLFGKKGGGSGKFDWTSLFGMLHFADGGFVDEEQVVHVSEGNKREAIVNVSKADARAKGVWMQAGLEMGMFKTGVQPNFKNKNLARNGVVSQTQQMQSAMLAQQQAQNQRMNNALNVIASNTEQGGVQMMQPVMMKQTITDNELATQIMRLKRNGKLK